MIYETNDLNDTATATTKTERKKEKANKLYTVMDKTDKWMNEWTNDYTDLQPWNMCICFNGVRQHSRAIVK